MLFAGVKLTTNTRLLRYDRGEESLTFSEDRKPGAAPGIGAFRLVCLAFLSGSSDFEPLSDSYHCLLCHQLDVLVLRGSRFMLGLMTKALLYLAEYLLSFRQAIQAVCGCHVAVATLGSGSRS